MDQSTVLSHHHKIEKSNYIEYEPPNSSKVKYAPPSPTTSGYSESGSEMDNHDSGRVSEMENSPKMGGRRPNTIALSMGVFNPGEKQVVSPGPFVEGKTTIRNNSRFGSESDLILKNTLLSGDYALPQDAFASGRKAQAGDDGRKHPVMDTVLVNAEVLRTLVLCVQDARTRLNSVEGKVDGLVRAIQMQQKHSNNALVKLSKTLLALGSGFNRLAASRELENGKIPSQFRPRSPQGVCNSNGWSSPNNNMSVQIPITNLNNNAARSASSDPPRFAFSECEGSRKPPVPPKQRSLSSDCQTATFPRFLRNSKPVFTPVSLPPSADKEDEVYDNVTAENKTDLDPASSPQTTPPAVDPDASSTIPKRYVNHEIIRTSLVQGDQEARNDPDRSSTRSPVYAVVKKKNKYLQQNILTDNGPVTPEGARDPITSQGGGITRNSRYELEKMIQDMTSATDSRSPLHNSTRSESLAGTSRFSDVDNLVSYFESAATVTEDGVIVDEELRITSLREDSDRASMTREHDPSQDSSEGRPKPQASSSPRRKISPESRQTVPGGDRSSHTADNTSAVTFPDLVSRARFPEPVAKTGQIWHELEIEDTYASIPNVERPTVVQPYAKSSQLSRGKSVDSLRPQDKSLSSLDSDISYPKTKRGRKKTTPPKDSETKKTNAIQVQVNRLFRRKNKPPTASKKSKRSVSQNSFTFVESPLYLSEKVDEASKESPRNLRRFKSLDSDVSSHAEQASRDITLSSLSNLTSSREGSSDFPTARQANSEAQGVVETDGKFRRSSKSLISQSVANSQLLRLQGSERLQDDSSSLGEFDNLVDEPEIPLSLFVRELESSEEHPYENDEMRPNLFKFAKKAFRNSPKLHKKSKSNGSAPNTTDDLHIKQGDDCTRVDENGNLCHVVESVTGCDDTPAGTNVMPAGSDVTDENFDDDVFIRPGVILERQQHEKAERMQFDTERTRAADEPPPKPNRPGFSHGGVQGSPRTSAAHGSSNGTVPGSGMYPPARGMPAVPPKSKIMTPEELTNHEAHEKLRLKQMEEAMLQQRLGEQQKQAEENAKWLQQEEQMLNPDKSTANGEDSAMRRGRGSSNSLGEMQAPPPPTVAPSKPPRKASKPKEEPSGPPQTKLQLEEVKTAPTMQLNRDDDAVYKDTMEVVKAVLGMNNMTMNAKPEELFTSVKVVGAALKQLCTSLEQALPFLPEDFHREIDMAQKTTNKDLSQVINQLKLVQRFFATTQVVDYKKCLMAANQVLAIDAKNLLDVVDRARIRKIQTAQENAARAQMTANAVHQGAYGEPASYEPEDFYPTDDVS